MKLACRIVVVAAIAQCVLALVAQSPRTPAPRTSAPTIEQLLSHGYPSEIVSARKADRIAWIAYERRQRDVYSAACVQARS